MSSSRNVVATDFRCALGTAEFSFGGCDRQALQDILQFLCGLREDGVQGSFVASWKRGCTAYELRRVDDGAADGGDGRGLFVGSGTGTSVPKSRGSGVELPSGLASGTVGCDVGKSEGCASGAGNDNAVSGKESVPAWTSRRVAQQSTARVGGAGAGTPSLDLGSRTGPPRGPNYARNQANREKKRLRRAELREQQARPVGFFSECDEEVQQKLRESRAKLLIAENERRFLEEKKKIANLESPMVVVKEALAMVEMSRRSAKYAVDNKVAGWAQGLSEAYAETLARSAPSSVPAFGSSGSVKPTSAVSSKSKVGVALNQLEAAAINLKVLTKQQLLEARKKAGRPLVAADFLRESFPYTMDDFQYTNMAQFFPERPNPYCNYH